MPKKKSRASRRRAQVDERWTFPIFVLLVLGVMLLGLLSYTAVLVAGSAISAGYFGWQWWQRRARGGAK